MLTVLGGASLVWRGDAASLPGWAAVLAVAGGVGIAAASEWERRRLAATGTRVDGPADRRLHVQPS